jgi:uncharacterized protein YprB with RNaseH-like and TPR domain
LPQLLAGAACVDVETGSDASELTVVGVLDRDGPHAFLRGRDLHQFPARAASWTCLITFNGLAFDLPALRRAFPSWQPPAAHVDLGHLQAYNRILRRTGMPAPPLEVTERGALLYDVSCAVLRATR